MISFFFFYVTLFSIFQVSLRLTTDPGSAQADIDYYSVDKTLVFEDGITTKRVAIEIINDSVPEGPEEFFVNITGT